MTRGDNLKLKSKLVAGASSLVMAGGMILVAAPAAHATPVIIDTTGGPQQVGVCTDTVQLVKLTTAVKGVGLGDQTLDNVKAAGNVAKDQNSHLVVNGGGSCSGVTPHGDKHIPFPTSGSNGVSGLTAKSAAVSITGNASCAQDAGGTAFDQENDATADNAYPLHGKITWTFNNTYNDLITAAPKPYKMQAMVNVLGFSANPLTPDVIDLGGMVLSGVNAGAIVGGSVWFDPVVKDGGAAGYNTGYDVDLGAAVGCQDDTETPSTHPAQVNDANIGTVLSGGGPATPSLLGSTTPGITFTFGE